MANLPSKRDFGLQFNRFLISLGGVVSVAYGWNIWSMYLFACNEISQLERRQA